MRRGTLGERPPQSPPPRMVRTDEGGGRTRACAIWHAWPANEWQPTCRRATAAGVPTGDGRDSCVGAAHHMPCTRLPQPLRSPPLLLPRHARATAMCGWSCWRAWWRTTAVSGRWRWRGCSRPRRAGTSCRWVRVHAAGAGATRAWPPPPSLHVHASGCIGCVHRDRARRTNTSLTSSLSLLQSHVSTCERALTASPCMHTCLICVCVCVCVHRSMRARCCSWWSWATAHARPAGRCASAAGMWPRRSTSSRRSRRRKRCARALAYSTLAQQLAALKAAKACVHACPP